MDNEGRSRGGWEIIKRMTRDDREGGMGDGRQLVERGGIWMMEKIERRTRSN